MTWVTNSNIFFIKSQKKLFPFSNFLQLVTMLKVCYFSVCSPLTLSLHELLMLKRYVVNMFSVLRSAL